MQPALKAVPLIVLPVNHNYWLHSRRCIRWVTVTWSYQQRVGRFVTGLSLLPHPVLGTDLKLLHSTASFKSKLKSFLFHAAYSGNTVWTLECAIGLTVGGALQVTVVTVTVTQGTILKQNKPEHELTAYNIFFFFFDVKPHNTAINNKRLIFAVHCLNYTGRGADPYRVFQGRPLHCLSKN